MTKHYIEFYYPGAFFPENSIKEIKNRRTPRNIPKSSYGFMYFDQEEFKLNDEILTGERKNKSGMTFLGKKYTIEELKKDFPDHKILISNIENNGYQFAVKTRLGNWQPVGEIDKVIDI